MKAIVQQTELRGSIRAPPSKSYTHRAIVCGLLSKNQTQISNPLFCEDTQASLRLSRMMGAQITNQEDLLVTGPETLVAPTSEMDCGGSGTTIRLYTALAALTNGPCVLTGDQSLQARPMTDLLHALDQLGIKATSIRNDGKPPVEVIGKGLSGGKVRIRGDISSQYISGLLFACSKSEEDTTIEITTRLESRPYVEMTLEVMKHFGVSAWPSELWDSFSVPGNQEYIASHYEIPGDFSSAAFLLAAGALHGKVRVTNLNKGSLQGDALIIELLKKMSALIIEKEDGYEVSASELEPIEVDVSHTPDLVPVLVVLASQADGCSRIYNAQRLRFKESDRLTTMSTELKKMGGRVKLTDDGIDVEGPTKLQGAMIETHNDHRIAMACTIAGLIASGSTVILGAECVSKSYPNFMEDIQSLGAEISINKKEGGE
ncbi:MAG: 3-phosphoshikimate 1-carboxyvinyltransferase [Candidatus Thorarchaeota archaeon]